jgi:ubiquinone/menaquinone biosynthesis C-methylase UbiE
VSLFGSSASGKVFTRFSGLKSTPRENMRIRKLLIPEKIPDFAADLYNRGAYSARQKYYSKIADEIASEIESGRILDIGTGPGYLPIEIAKRLTNTRIDGIDLSKRMIELARENAKNADVLSQINFEQGNAIKLEFEDNLYDIVVSTGVFHSWKHPVRAIDEIHRVLKPEGLALIYDPALIFTSTKEFLGHCINWRDKLAFLWALLAYLLSYPMVSSKESVETILSQTSFQNYEVEKKDDIRMRLHKLSG